MRRFLLALGVLLSAAAPLVPFTPAGGLTEVSSFPNPFDSRKEHATIRYRLVRPRKVEIRIFDVFGTPVWSKSIVPASEGARAGANEVDWDGTDEEGHRVAKGMYLAVIRAGADKTVLKIGVVH